MKNFKEYIEWKHNNHEEWDHDYQEVLNTFILYTYQNGRKSSDSMPVKIYSSTNITRYQIIYVVLKDLINDLINKTGSCDSMVYAYNIYKESLKESKKIRAIEKKIRKYDRQISYLSSLQKEAWKNIVAWREILKGDDKHDEKTITDIHIKLSENHALMNAYLNEAKRLAKLRKDLLKDRKELNKKSKNITYEGFWNFIGIGE